MTARTLDPARMSAAIPAIEQLVTLLENNSRTVAGISAPAGVPGPLAARVAHTTHAVSGALARAADTIDGLPAELRRRVVAAQFADSPALAAAGWSLPAFTFFAKSFNIQNWNRSTAAGRALRDLAAAFRAGGPDVPAGPRGAWARFRADAAAARAANTLPRGVPAGLATAGKWGGRGFTGLNWAVTLATNVRNPNLTTGQKIGRTAASVATGAGVSIMASAAAGAAFGSAAGPVGTLVGFGAGTAWAIADKKLHVSDKIGDGAAAAGKAVGHAAGAAGKAVGHAAGDAAGAVGDAAGSVADGANKVADGVADGANKVAGGVADGANKVADGASKLADGASSVAGGAKSAAKKALGAIGL